jgi:hypothetical protein
MQSTETVRGNARGERLYKDSSFASCKYCVDKGISFKSVENYVAQYGASVHFKEKKYIYQESIVRAKSCIFKQTKNNNGLTTFLIQLSLIIKLYQL